jgi:hypothetical protein
VAGLAKRLALARIERAEAAGEQLGYGGLVVAVKRSVSVAYVCVAAVLA